MSNKRLGHTAQKRKFSIKDFFGKCDKICRKLRIWSHLLNKSLMENFIFFVQCQYLESEIFAKSSLSIIRFLKIICTYNATQSQQNYDMYRKNKRSYLSLSYKFDVSFMYQLGHKYHMANMVINFIYPKNKRKEELKFTGLKFKGFDIKKKSVTRLER